MSASQTYPVHSVDEFDGEPTIVSISDVHGYLDGAADALRMVGESGREPVVEEDDGLHWAGNDYVLVVNGDLIDHGPASVETLETVRRMQDEAPGRVIQTLGNHELGLMMPDTYGERVPTTIPEEIRGEVRGRFIEDVAMGRVNAAFEGHSFTYSHAGRRERFDVKRVNRRLQEAGEELNAEYDDGVRFRSVEHRLVDDPKYHEVFGTVERDDSEDGLVWGEYAFPGFAPAQVVGHSGYDNPQQTEGYVINQNTIRDRANRRGGAAVVVEEPDAVHALVRGATGGVVQEDYSLP